MADLPRLTVPLNERPLDGQGNPTGAWAAHYQDVADRLGGVGTGTKTGDNAAAGAIGEYIEAAFGSVSLANGVNTDVGTLSLTAGDWEVRGTVTFTSTTTTLHVVQAWVSATAATPYLPAVIVVPIAVMGTGTALWAGPVRISSAAPGLARLGAMAQFSSGAASATGFMMARRVR